MLTFKQQIVLKYVSYFGYLTRKPKQHLVTKKQRIAT